MQIDIQDIVEHYNEKIKSLTESEVLKSAQIRALQRQNATLSKRVEELTLKEEVKETKNKK
jgi:hypothetical protein